MNAITLAQNALIATKGMFSRLMVDLNDADLLVRPTPGANHIAWQIGHVILAERRMGEGLPADTPYPDLPPGFVEKHGKESAAQDSGFLSKAEYERIFDATRDTTVARVGKMTEADLDKPTSGPVTRMAATLGAMVMLINNHAMMHSGQFSVVRRKLGKPVLF